MKTRILAIAPYQGLKELMTEITKERNDIELTIDIGDLENGLNIAKSYDLDDFDVIISRGGTAKMLAANVSLPVVEVEISVYDILRTIKLAENYAQRFAIIGYPAITDCAKMLCHLLKYDIDIVTLGENITAESEIKELHKKGYEMILCDMVGTSIAYELGMNFILITSGRESVECAIEQAVRSSQLFHSYKEQIQVLKAAIVQSRESLFVYTQDGEFIFSSMERSNVTETFFSYVENNLSSFLADPRFRLEERMGILAFSLYSRHVTLRGQAYVYIYLYIQDAPVLIDELGVSLYEKKNAAAGIVSDFHGSANFIGETRRMLEQYAPTSFPVLILGETGTGKDKAASYLYEHSEYAKRPFFIIDCQQTNQKKWNYLMENINSPFNDLHTTIYIKNLQALNDTLSEKFLSSLKQNDFCKRNRFIFSLALNNPEDEFKPSCQYLKNVLSSLVLRLPPLRERIKDLPSIATLYISQANIELGKQVVGFDPDAMELLKSFSWKQNLDQFKRVIRQLIVLTPDYYISSDLVKQVLKQEVPAVPSSTLPGYEMINMNQSLDDITYDIVRIVLEQEGMNKSKAVERLKISRSTLWRMLQR